MHTPTERATQDSLAFRFIACNRHPDHDTLANFRRRFGDEFKAVFVQAREQVEYETKLAAREAKAAATGKKPRGRPPQSPTAGPRPTDQVNLTDPESRIMLVPGGGFEQCYNAQAVVDTESGFVLAPDVTQIPNDKEQRAPIGRSCRHEYGLNGCGYWQLPA